MTEREKKITKLYPRYETLTKRIAKIQRLIAADFASETDKTLLTMDLKDKEAIVEAYNEQRKRKK